MTIRDILLLAHQLAAGPAEAFWRCAVNRAYFAAFLTARQVLEALGFAVPHADQGHRHVWLRLSNCGDALVQRAGADLNSLRGDRNHADYDLHRPFLQRLARPCVQTADRIIHIVDAVRQEPTRTQITDAMKIYERDVLKDVTWHP